MVSLVSQTSTSAPLGSPEFSVENRGHSHTMYYRAEGRAVTSSEKTGNVGGTHSRILQQVVVDGTPRTTSQPWAVLRGCVRSLRLDRSRTGWAKNGGCGMDMHDIAGSVTRTCGMNELQENETLNAGREPLCRHGQKKDATRMKGI